MKHKLFLLALLFPVIAVAGSPFDGTWKFDVHSVRYNYKPDVFTLRNGEYSCLTCQPMIKVKADGNDQTIPVHFFSNSSSYDSLNVKVVDAKTVEISRSLHGKTMSSETLTVSDDNKSLTNVIKDVSGKEVVTATYLSKRVKKGSAGSHAISGAWERQSSSGFSESGITANIKMTDDGFQMSYNGMSYNAKFDGGKYLTANDPSNTWVSLRRLSKDTVEETDTNDGKVTVTTKLKVSADGKSIKMFERLPNGSTIQSTLLKQP